MPLTIVALNMAAHDRAFGPIRALGDVEVVHAEYRSSWAEVSARRAGVAAAVPEEIADLLRAALQRADVVFGFVVPRTLLELAPRLRWVATPATGIDHMRGTGVLEADVVLTTVGGHFAPLIAEHVFAGILHFAKCLPTFHQQQRAHVWKMSRVAALAGRTLGLIGVGAIGSAVARLAQAFGMEVIGIGRGEAAGRQIAGIDRLLRRSQLPELLAAADYIVVAVADTAETRHMLGAAELAALQPRAVLINVARGTVLDETALADALRAGRLAGAMLDVVSHEPLAADSPLWDLPNVLLTPHVATSIPEYLPQAIALFAEDVRRFRDGEPLQHPFDRRRGY